MTKRERVERTVAFEPADKPPFVPAIYEHKARLIGRSPSEVCRSLDLLGEALHKELEVYDPDVLTVGLDVYNVEAEAVGCEVRYFGNAPDVPAVAAPSAFSRGKTAGAVATTLVSEAMSKIVRSLSVVASDAKPILPRDAV